MFNLLADVIGTAVGMFFGFPWLIAIGFLVSRHPLGCTKSFQWLAIGAALSMLSIWIWFALVEAQFGSSPELRYYLGSVLTMVVSALIFRGFRRLKQRSRSVEAQAEQ